MSELHAAERAVAYWTNELPLDERAAVDAHLRGCAACRREFDAVRIALDAVSAWPQDPALPDHMAQRIVNRASSARRPRGLGSLGRPAVAAIIAGIACGLGGFIAGRSTSPAGSDPATPVSPAADSTLKSFLLLLEERAWPPATPLVRSGYRDWSRAIAAQERYGGAQKLTDESGYRVESDGRAVRPESSQRPPNVSGWYIVRARSYDEAIEWARRGPHLAHGSVLVREIEQ